MKTAEEYQGQLVGCSIDNVAPVVEAIREEMRQECEGDAITAAGQMKHVISYGDLGSISNAIRNAGKPKLRTGQVVGYIIHNTDGSDPYIYKEKVNGGRWSDLCDWEGHEQSAYDGDVFLKEAMR